MLGPVWEPNIVQKLIEIQAQSKHRFLSSFVSPWRGLLGSFWDPFWSDSGMLLATFWGPKALHSLKRFFKSFLGAEADRRVSGGTLAQLFPRLTPPGGALFAHGGIQ